MKYFIALMVFFLFAAGSGAQTPNWRVFTPANSGLPDSPIYKLGLDSCDGMWIGLHAGLVHYTQDRWTHFDTPGFVNGLSGMSVAGCGDVWVSAGPGRALRRHDGKWQVFDTLPHQTLGNIVVERNGDVWVADQTHLLHYDGTRWDVSYPPWIHVGGSAIWDVAIDSKGKKWTGGYDGLYSYDAGIWERVDSSHAHVDDILTLIVDDRDRVIMGTYYESRWTTPAIAMLDHGTWRTWSREQLGFPEVSITSLLVDTLGVLWAGTSHNGLLRITDSSITVYDSTNSPIPGNYISDLELNGCGTLWISTLRPWHQQYGANSIVQHRTLGVRPLPVAFRAAILPALTEDDTTVVPLRLDSTFPDETFGPLTFTLEFDTGCVQLLAVTTPPGTLFEGVTLQVTPVARGAIIEIPAGRNTSGAVDLMMLTFRAAARQEDTVECVVSGGDVSVANRCSFIPAFTPVSYTVLPKLPKVRCELESPSAIVWSRVVNTYQPDTFRVAMKIINDGEEAAYNPRFTLQYSSDVLQLIMPTDSLQAGRLSVLAAGDTMEASWIIAMAVDLLEPRESQICITAEFDNHVDVTCCSDLSLDNAEPILECTIIVPEILANEVLLEYDPMPFPVTVMVRNVGTPTTEDIEVLLSLPPEIRLYGVDAPDHFTKSLTPRQLKSGEEGSVSWLCWFDRSPVKKSLPILAVPRTANADTCSCFALVDFPAVFGPRLAVQCSGPAELTWNTDSGSYIPNPFEMVLTAVNRSDSRADNVRGSIIIPPGFVLDPPSQLLTQTFTPSTMPRWKLTDPVPELRWTLRWTENDRHERIEPVQFEVLAENVRNETVAAVASLCSVKVAAVPAPFICDLEMPDSLLLNAAQNALLPNPVPIRYTLRNRSGQPARCDSLILTFIAPGLELHPSSQYGLRESIALTLQSGEDASFEWLLSVRNQPIPRMAFISVHALDAEGFRFECADSLFVPSLQGLLCSTRSVDTISFDEDSVAYFPNPVMVTLDVRNAQITAQTQIEAEIDLSSAPLLQLASGESAAKYAAVLDSLGSVSFSWYLEPLATGTDSTQRIALRYRSSEEPAWSQCMRNIVVERWPEILSVRCIDGGHDSIFADPFYERYIPDPLTLTYTVTNTGTVPLRNCTASIMLPKGFMLVEGDSTQLFGTLQPHDAVTRWWSVEATSDLLPGATAVFEWGWSSDEQGSIAGCTHPVAVLPGSPSGVVLTPLVLYFTAERGGQLPLPQALRIWNGSGLSIPWSVQPSASWLNADPPTGNQAAVVQIQPNTTLLDQGQHSAGIAVSASTGPDPQNPLVIYEITQTTSVDNSARANDITPDIRFWPNPVTRGGELMLRAEGGETIDRVVLVDLLGRTIELTVGSNYGSTALRVRLSSHAIASGSYMLRGYTRHGVTSQLLLVLP